MSSTRTTCRAARGRHDPEAASPSLARPTSRRWAMRFLPRRAARHTAATPFIYCTLLNFGGMNGIVGDMPRLEEGFNTAAAAAHNSSLSGVGLTMEGIGTNYPMFERTLQLGWEPARPEERLDEWWARYGVRRYGRSHPSAVAAWRLLGRTAYAGHASSNVTAGLGSPISSHPRNFACPPRRLPPSQPTRALLAATFARAWRLLLEAAPALDRAESFRSVTTR